VNETKVVEEQQQFTEHDSSSDEAFLNVFDKGFCNVLEAKQRGNDVYSKHLHVAMNNSQTRILSTLHVLLRCT